MMKENQDDGYKIFLDYRNIQIGKGRILWGTETQNSKMQHFKEGWVLPGGQRTKDEKVAIEWAKWIDANSR
jgi:hypothetical protein